MNVQDKLIEYMFSKIQAALKIYLTGTHTYSLDILPGLWKTLEFKKKPQLYHSKKKKKQPRSRDPAGLFSPAYTAFLFVDKILIFFFFLKAYRSDFCGS